MFSIDKSVPLNANLKPGDPALTRDHIWEGLLMKAYDAKPFGFLWSLSGGILGIWIGYRFGQSY